MRNFGRGDDRLADQNPARRASSLMQSHLKAVNLQRADEEGEEEEEEKKEKDKKDGFSPIEATLLKNRTLTLFGEVNQDVARATVSRLLAMDFENDKPITMLVSSPGGHVESGDAIYDVVRFIKAPVKMVGTGWVGSIATHIYLAVPKERRFCTSNTRFLIHQPAGGFGGDASDIEIHAREILKTRERINKVIAEATGQSIERVTRDTERDYWMSAEESKEYGLVGRIITSSSELT